MAFMSRSVDIPLFIRIEPGAVHRLGEIIREHNLFFRSAVVIGDKVTMEVAGEDVAEALRREGCRIHTIEVHGNTREAVEDVRGTIREAKRKPTK